MNGLKQMQVWWVLANVIGIGAFLALASKVWIEPELASEPGASAGDSLVWGVSALPFLILFFLLHLAVSGMALERRQRAWALPIIVTTISWIAAAVFDRAQHGI